MDKSTPSRYVQPLLSLMLCCCLSAQAQVQSPAPLPPVESKLQSLAQSPATPSVPRALQIQAWKTVTGTKVLFIQTSELPIFDVHVSFAAGSARDPQHPALAAATFSLLNEGIQGKSLAQINETFDGLGARWGMDISHDRTSFSLRGLSAPQKREPALQLFAQMLGQPLLAEDALLRVKSELLGIIESQQQDPLTQVFQGMSALLFNGHPYAQSVYGTAQDLATLSREQVQAFHKAHYHAGNTQITLVGDLTLEQAQGLSLQISNSLPVKPTTLAVPDIPVASPTVASRHIEQAQHQTHLLLAQPGVSRKHPDYVALRVANLIFAGSSSGSRLMKELRVKRGLTYGVSMATADKQWANPTGIYVQTQAQYSEGTLTLIKSLFRDYLLTGPTARELDDAKRLILGSSALASASNAQILSGLFEINRHDLPFDLDFSAQQAQSLTVEQIKAALNRHYNADHWSVVTLGPTLTQQALPEPVDRPGPGMCRAEEQIVAS